MAPTSAARRPGRLTPVLVVLVALLGALLPVRDTPVEATAGETVSMSPVEAMTPARAAGRLLAEPSLVCVVHGTDLPAGTAPSGMPPVALARFGENVVTTLTAHDIARHATAGVRAPPRQVDS